MGYLENVMNMAHTKLNFSSVFQQSKLSSNNEGSVCMCVCVCEESEKLSCIHKTQICDDNLKQSTAKKLPNFKIVNYQEIVCM